MPKAYPAEFRHRAVALVRAGRKVPVVAADLEISDAVLWRWVRQDRIDNGEVPGIATAESAELRKARKRIRELEQELEILKIASKFLGEEAPHPKGFTR
ncbi:transposase [Sediminivirga luteola]